MQMVRKDISSPLKGLNVGDVILSGETATPDTGHAKKLKNLPLGTTIHNIEMAR